MKRNAPYLREIEKIQNEFKKNNLRTVVGGGFAIDGFLERITREHSDLDFDIVGNSAWIDGFKKTEKILKEIYGDKLVVNDRRFEAKRSNLRIDFEYVQDLVSKKRFCYRFGSGNYEFPVPFYLSRKGKLNSLIFDIENPHYIFAIKYLMPVSGEKKIREKDRSDIKNLLDRLNKKDLIKVFHFQLDYIAGKIKK